MIKPSQLFKETKEVIEVVEETIENKQPLEENMSLAVTLIDGAFKTIQEHILTANKEELDPYKNQLLEVYNVCYDIAENQLPKFRKEIIHSDIKTDSKINKLREEVYNTLEQRIEETKETIQVYFRKEVKELKNLRANVVLVEKYIKKNSSAIVDLREEVFAQIRESGNDSEVNQIVIQDKLDEISKEYETLSEGLLNEPPTSGTGDPLMDQNFVTLDQLQSHYKLFVNRVTQQLSTLGGGGEVNLRYLDDIVGVATNLSAYNGKYLQVDTSNSTQPFKFTTVVQGGGGGGGSYTGTSGQLLQHNGSDYVGVSSVGIATFINNYHQGYYRYTTDYYTTGVANTSQGLPADQFVLIQPQVRTNRTKFMPQKMLDVNNNDPWVGTGATIGTGQTTFSLAGLDAGSTVIVRIAAQFDPDVDNTNLDFKLEFTTNPTTQGFGVTNFSVIREQALICNEGADQPYISETLINFYVGNSLSGLTTADAGKFSLHARASDEGDFEMMALTINVVA